MRLFRWKNGAIAFRRMLAASHSAQLWQLPASLPHGSYIGEARDYGLPAFSLADRAYDSLASARLLIGEVKNSTLSTPPEIEHESHYDHSQDHGYFLRVWFAIPHELPHAHWRDNVKRL